MKIEIANYTITNSAPVNVNGMYLSRITITSKQTGRKTWFEYSHDESELSRDSILDIVSKSIWFNPYRFQRIEYYGSELRKAIKEERNG